MAIPIAVIFTAFLVVLACYFTVSRHESNYVNVLTPLLVFQVPAFYLSEGLGVVRFGPSGSNEAYLLCYLIYTASIVGLTAGYLATKNNLLIHIFPTRSAAIGLRAEYICLAAGWLVFYPIIVDFPEVFLRPREVYEVTRVGYGVPFFLSTIFTYVAVVLFLFNRNKTTLTTAGFFFSSVLLAYLHGSKGQLIALLFIWLLFQALVASRKYSPVGLLNGASLAILAFLLLFYIGTSEFELEKGLSDAIVNYADYTRNSLLVIDDSTLDFQYGRLYFESLFYGPIPRALLPDKPLDFGPYWLVARYFPERFELQSGAPAFGIGTTYADFGLFAPLVQGLIYMAVGAFLKVLINRLRLCPDPGTFFIVLALVEVPVLPIGINVSPVIIYVIGYLIFVVSGSNLARPASSMVSVRP